MDTEGASMRGGTAEAVRPTERPAAQLFTEVVRGREAFLKLKTAWDQALGAGPDPSPSLQHDFLRLWLENFAPSATPLALVARQEGKIAGALGLTVDAGTVDGVPVRLAAGWSNPHSTRGGVLLGKPGLSVVDALVRRSLDEAWDVLHLRDVPREGAVLDTVAQALRDQGCEVVLESPMDSPYVPLPGTWEELEKRLDARFRQNLRRRRRRLEEQGPVAFEVVTGGDGLDAALESAFDIEASGWKGAEGSAIRARPELVAFYAGWARQLARQGKLRLCFLKLGEERIAFHFAYVEGRRYYLPKCGFRESYSEVSPGQQLMAEVLKRCMEERLESFEFLGFSMPWKRDWTPLVRPHASLWAFRPTVRGRLARLVRAEVRPRAAQARRWMQQKGEEVVAKANELRGRLEDEIARRRGDR